MDGNTAPMAAEEGRSVSYTEDAKINLAKGKEDERALQLAQVQATLAVVEAIESLSSQVAYLSDSMDGLLPASGGQPRATIDDLYSALSSIISHHEQHRSRLYKIEEAVTGKPPTWE